MSKLLDKIKYESKVLELRGMVEGEAKKLQDILDSKALYLGELSVLAERKSKLLRQLNGLEAQIREADAALSQTIDRKAQFINSAKVELAKERGALNGARKLFVKTNAQVKGITVVVNELAAFVSKESNARERWLAEQGKLNASEKKRAKIMSEMEKKRLSIEEEKKSLDEMKTYVSNLYGKLATYTKIAKETIEQVNKALEDKVPLRFELPPGEKEIKVEFDTFSKYI